MEHAQILARYRRGWLSARNRATRLREQRDEWRQLVLQADGLLARFPVEMGALEDERDDLAVRLAAYQQMRQECAEELERARAGEGRYRAAWLSACGRARRLRTMLGYSDRAVTLWSAELDRVKAQRNRLQASADANGERLRSLLEMVAKAERDGRTPEVQSALRAAYYVMSGRTAKQALADLEAQSLERSIRDLPDGRHWALCGPQGAVTFLLEDFAEHGNRDAVDRAFVVMHSARPLNDYQEPPTSSCPFLGTCHAEMSDGGGVFIATEWETAGHDDGVIWRWLTEYHRDYFAAADMGRV